MTVLRASTLNDLRIFPVPSDRDRGRDELNHLHQFTDAHNRALDEFQSGYAGIGVLNGRRLAERRILDLCVAIDSIVTHEFHDEYAVQYLALLLRGFRGLLNMETGNLACAKLDAWVADAATLCRLDPDQLH